jgi:hypothetical protein
LSLSHPKKKHKFGPSQLGKHIFIFNHTPLELSGTVQMIGENRWSARITAVSCNLTHETYMTETA